MTDGISFSTSPTSWRITTPGRPTRPRPSFRDYVNLEVAYQASPRAAKAAKFWETKARRAAYRPCATTVARAADDRWPWSACPFGSAIERTLRLARVAESEAIQLLGPEFSRLVALSTVIFAFLYRTTGNRELVLGTPIANRSHPLAATCGLVMEQLFLKVEIEDNETFASLARKVRTDLATR